MAKRIVPDPVETRDSIRELREDIAKCRRVIARAKVRIAELDGGHDYSENPPPPSARPTDERPGTQEVSEGDDE